MGMMTIFQSFRSRAAEVETSFTLCSARRKLISPRAQCIVFPVGVVCGCGCNTMKHKTDPTIQILTLILPDRTGQGCVCVSSAVYKRIWSPNFGNVFNEGTKKNKKNV